MCLFSLALFPSSASLVLRAISTHLPQEWRQHCSFVLQKATAGAGQCFLLAPDFSWKDICFQVFLNLLLSLLAFSSFTRSQDKYVSIPDLCLLLPLNWSQLYPAPETEPLQWPGANLWWFICMSRACLLIILYQQLHSLCHHPVLAPLYVMLYSIVKYTFFSVPFTF